VISSTLTNGEKTMRRSASEVIRNLEMRIARLERNASPNALADFIDFCMEYDLKEEGDLAKVNQIDFLKLIAKNKFGAKGLKLRNRQVMLTSFGEQVLNENMRVARLEKQSRRNVLELDEDGDLVDAFSVGDEYIDLRDVAHEILDSGEFQDAVEEAGEDIEDIDESDLDLGILYEGAKSRKEKGLFYFIVEESNYDVGVIVSINPEGEPSIDHISDMDDVWRTLSRWT
jgi:hypothetical protein